MSMGIYYGARRGAPLSAEEKAKIKEITDKYWKEYARKDEYEGPGTFTPEDGDEAIYSGVLRMPLEFLQDGPKGMEGFDAMEEFLEYWLKWLTDVTRAVPGAEWDVQFEDFPLVWDDESGWRMMDDEEFGSMGFTT